MNGKLVSLQGKLGNREIEIDKKRSLALAAQGGKRIAIRFDEPGDRYVLESPDYPVTINNAAATRRELNDGDIIDVGENRFRFEYTSSRKRGDATAAVDQGDIHDTERGIPPVDDEMDVTDTVQAGHVEFCQECGVPITTIDIQKNRARKVGFKLFCSDCYARKFDQGKTAPAAARGAAAPGTRAGRSGGTAGRAGGRDRQTPRGGTPGGARPTERKAAARGTEVVAPPAAKPAARKEAERTDGRRAGATGRPGTEPLNAPAPVRAASGPARTPVKAGGSEILEPLEDETPRRKERPAPPASGKAEAPRAAEKTASKKPVTDKAAAPSAVSRRSRGRAESDEPAGPPRPNPFMAFLSVLGRIFKGILGGIAAVLKAIGRAIKRSGLKRQIRANLFKIGTEVHRNPANILVAPDTVLEKAAALKAAHVKDLPAADRARTQTEFGQLVYDRCIADPGDMPILRYLAAIAKIEAELEALNKGGTQPVRERLSGRHRAAASAPVSESGAAMTPAAATPETPAPAAASAPVAETGTAAKA
ncbi:MAG: hypothetical protein ABIF71_10705 [Planctomycetota bacterium]